MRTFSRHFYSWGRGATGQVSGAPAGMAVRSIAAGAYHTCALTLDGSTARCWGSGLA